MKTGRIVETRDAVGTVRAFESIIVTAKVAGIIDKIAFEEGQKVKAGDVLVSLDALERRADIEQRGRRDPPRYRDRATRSRPVSTAPRRSAAPAPGTEAQVEDLTAQVKTLESAIASAEAQRKAAEARLEDIIVRAPFAGRVGTRSVSLGAYVSPGTRITTLDDLSKVRLDFSVPENLLGPAQVRAGRERHLRGLPRPGVRGQGVDRRHPRRPGHPDGAPDRRIRQPGRGPASPACSCRSALEVTTKDDAVVVPEEAVVSEGLRQIVYPVKDNKVERRVIRIGQRQGGKVEVVEGLKAGETIVVLGVQRVAPGHGQRAPGRHPARRPPGRSRRCSPPGSATTRGALNAVGSRERGRTLMPFPHAGRPTDGLRSDARSRAND